MKNWRKTLSPETLAISGFFRLMKGYRDYDKSAFYLPRHHVMTFSRCAELWRIMGIFCGNACPFFKIQTTVWLRMPKDRKNNVKVQPRTRSITDLSAEAYLFYGQMMMDIWGKLLQIETTNSSWLPGHCTGIYDDPWGVLFCRRIKQWKMKNSHLRCEGGSK